MKKRLSARISDKFNNFAHKATVFAGRRCGICSCMKSILTERRRKRQIPLYKRIKCIKFRLVGNNFFSPLFFCYWFSPDIWILITLGFVQVTCLPVRQIGSLPRSSLISSQKPRYPIIKIIITKRIFKCL